MGNTVCGDMGAKRLIGQSRVTQRKQAATPGFANKPVVKGVKKSLDTGVERPVYADLASPYDELCSGELPFGPANKYKFSFDHETKGRIDFDDKNQNILNAAYAAGRNDVLVTGPTGNVHNVTFSRRT